MNERLIESEGRLFPALLTRGNMMQYVEPIARQFCVGDGLDIGCGEHPFPGALPIDRNRGGDAMALPDGQFAFVFSSHALEHVPNPVAAIEHWKTRLRPGGVLFLYLPCGGPAGFPEWRPARNKEHLHTFYPADVAQMLRDLGFVDVIHSGIDLAGGFSVVGWNEG